MVGFFRVGLEIFSIRLSFFSLFRILELLALVLLLVTTFVFFLYFISGKSILFFLETFIFLSTSFSTFISTFIDWILSDLSFCIFFTLIGGSTSLRMLGWELYLSFLFFIWFTKIWCSWYFLFKDFMSSIAECLISYIYIYLKTNLFIK